MTETQMHIDLSDDAITFGAVVRDALGAAGGDALVQRAEAAPGTGDAAVGEVLAPLGVWDLDVRASGDEAEAAAAACRSAGWWAAPGAVASRLARPRDLDADAVWVVNGPRPSAPVHATTLRWLGVDLDGRRGWITPRPLGTSVRKTAFVTGVDLDPLDSEDVDDAAWALALGLWTLLGTMDRAMALTIAHVRDRHQFGKPLAAFQAVQFQLTEAEVERAGAEMLARHALWSVASRRAQALVDVLAARLAAVEAAAEVFRICHQLHGAIGFCDETTISWISRYSRPWSDLPLTATGTRTELVRRAGRAGIDGLFS